MNAKRFCLLSGLVACAGVLAAVSAERASTNSLAKAPPTRATNAIAKVHSRTNYAVIGHLAGRDGIITIKSGPEGALYTIRNAKGKLLCENRSLEQLRAEAPELHQLIKSAVANKASDKGGFMDASLSPNR